MLRTSDEGDLTRLVELERVHAGDAFNREQVRYLLTRANAINLVAEETGEAGEGRIIGSIVVLLRHGTTGAHLYSLTVDPERQGRGIARLLLGAAEARARARGLRSVRLEVREDNDRARRLYTAGGYLEIGLREDYYWDGCDAVLMEKRLDQEQEPPDGKAP